MQARKSPCFNAYLSGITTGLSVFVFVKSVLLSYCLYGHENDLAMAFHGLLLIGLTVITFFEEFWQRETFKFPRIYVSAYTIHSGQN